MTASLIVDWNAENGTVGAKPPAPLTAVSGPNIPLITASPVFAGTKAYSVYLNKNKPTILGAVQNPYRTEMRGGLNLEFERIYWIGMAFRRIDWANDTSSESFPLQVHEAPSTWENWGISPCTQSATSTAPVFFSNVNGQMRFMNLGNVLWTKPIDINVWHTLVIQIKLSKGTTGFIRSWYDGVEQPRYPTTGTRQTHRADSAMNAFCTPAGQPQTVFVPPLIALGVYKWDWKDGSTQVSQTTIRHAIIDSFKCAQDIAGNDDAGGYAMVNPVVSGDTTKPVVSAVSSSVTSNSSRINFTTNEVATTVINYGKTTSYGSAFSNLNLVTSHVADILNLDPNTDYQYQISTADASGNIQVEANRSFKTAPAALSVNNVEVVSITQTSAIVNFTTNIPVNSEVDYGLTTSYGSNKTDSVLKTTHSLTLTGLSPFSTYHFLASGTDGTSSALGVDTTFTTLSSVFNVVPTPISKTSQRITWQTNKAVIGSLQYGLTSAYGTTVNESVASTSHSLTISGLTEDTLYHYKVLGDDSVNSGDLTFNTVNDAPIISGIGYARTSTSITVNFTTNIGCKKVIKYGLTKAMTETEVIDNNFLTTHSVPLTGLLSGKWYYIEITVTNSLNVSQTVQLKNLTLTASGLKSSSFVSPLGAEWLFVDPKADSSYSLQTVSGRTVLRLSLVASSAHDHYTNALNGVRMRQALTNVSADFDIILYCDSIPSAATQGMGLLIEDASNTCVRFNFQYNAAGNDKRFFIATANAGVFNTALFSSNVPSQTTPVYMRIKRTAGTAWECFRSNNGRDWVSMVTFTFSMTATYAGVLAINVGSPAPAWNADFNLFLVDPGAISGPKVTVSADGPEPGEFSSIIKVKSKIVANDVDHGALEDFAEFSAGLTSRKFLKPKFRNSMKETSTSTGLFNITLNGAVSGNFPLSSGYVFGDQFTYRIKNLVANEVEIGQGHLKDTNILVRDFVETSSNNNEFVDFSAGLKEISTVLSSVALNKLAEQVDWNV